MKYLLIASLLISCFGSCSGQQKKKNIDSERIVHDTVASRTDTTKDTDPNKVSLDPMPARSFKKIGGAIGLLTLVDTITEKDTIKIYNADDTLWHKFTFFYDDSDGKYDFRHSDFNPLAFHPDYFLLFIQVMNTSNEYYEVIVNQNTKQIKKVYRQTPSLRFITWEEYVIGLFSVDFDVKTNPLVTLPEKEASTVEYDENEVYHPHKIQGDWLQLKWGTEDHWEYAWIKWRDGERLLIAPYYTA